MVAVCFTQSYNPASLFQRKTLLVRGLPAVDGARGCGDGFVCGSCRN